MPPTLAIAFFFHLNFPAPHLLTVVEKSLLFFSSSNFYRPPPPSLSRSLSFVGLSCNFYLKRLHVGFFPKRASLPVVHILGMSCVLGILGALRLTAISEEGKTQRKGRKNGRLIKINKSLKVRSSLDMAIWKLVGGLSSKVA